MRLPTLPYQVPRSRQELVALRGLNLSDNTSDGDLAACRNLSTRHWPRIATRSARRQLEGYTGVTALTAWGKLVAVSGTSLLYDGAVVGTVTPGAKQFAVVNTKLVIWPDKVYLDLDSLTVTPLGAEETATGAEFITDTATFTGVGDLTAKFRAGDGVTLAGGSIAANNKDIVIKAVTSNTLTVESNGFTAGTASGALTITRRVPKLDYICESGNRLWGCSNADRTIYSSALGDPTNFYVYAGLSTDSYAVAVGSDGDFTGCCKLSTSVLFWKEECLHKVLGSYPAEYAMYTYDFDGLRKGCHGSMQILNEVLYYMGLHGVYAFTGGSPALISANLGDRAYTGAIAGTNGRRYYLSAMRDGEPVLLCYDTQTGLWLQEDDTRCVGFARLGKDLYFADGDGGVWLADAGEDDPDVEWGATFAPFYDDPALKKMYARLTARLQVPALKKKYARLTARLQVPRGAWVRVRVRYDGGNWIDVATVTGVTDNVIPVPVPINRCDRFELMLEGRGPCEVLAMTREFAAGSV